MRIGKLCEDCAWRLKRCGFSTWESDIIMLVTDSKDASRAEGALRAELMLLVFVHGASATCSAN
jgi:hypothetical protein